MKTSDVVQLLYSIPVGAIIAWIVVISGIVSAIILGTIKMYKAFEKTKEIKDQNIEFINMVRSHDDQLIQINEKLECIQKNLDSREQNDITNMRYSIVRAGEEYLSAGNLTIRQLKSLEELFEVYQAKHGNGYVRTLMGKVRRLPVIGALDDNDNDIE